MHLQEQQQLSDACWLLRTRDLAPEEFVYWLIEWCAQALRARKAGDAR
ncbi:hypothetical protein [Pseudomonas sp. HY2-MNA-CIBAN-0224]